MTNWIARSALALAIPGLVIGMTPAAAHADDTTVTITVGATGALLDPTLVRVPANITCATLEVATNQGSATLKQAVYGRIAFGSGYAEKPVICDGTPHANSYLIWVDSTSRAPFRQGSATVQISAYLCSPTFTCESGGSGIQIVHLKR